jgi:hypothetical protein
VVFSNPSAAIANAPMFFVVKNLIFVGHLQKIFENWDQAVKMQDGAKNTH